MPLLGLLLFRVFRALMATVRLLVDVSLLRTLPWSYIRRLPFRNAWIGSITASLAGTLATCVALPFGPDQDTRDTIAGLGFLLAGVGLVSSWIRALIQWRQVRG